MHLYIVRHGEADGNTARRFLGWAEASLSERGVAEADAVAVRLSQVPVTKVLSSDLARASQTAERIAEHHGLAVTTDERYREIANGDWTGLLPEEVAARWPDSWATLLDGEDFSRPGGESWEDVRRRAVEAVLEIPDDGDDVVVLVTHSGTALTILQWAAGMAVGRDAYAGPFAPLHTGSISVVVMPGAWLLSVNDIGHLPAPAAPARMWIRREAPPTR